MLRPNTPRRSFLSNTAMAGLGIGFGVHSFGSNAASGTTIQNRSANERLGIGAIGLRYQGSVIAHKAQLLGDIVAVCDVDRNVKDQAKAAFGSTPHGCEDYRELLARKDVDVVTIGTPDHWHTKMVIDACRAGKDVYCEKPLTLTIEEGQQLVKVVKETGRVVQVGSWQRSDDRFRLAVEMVRSGRIGKLKTVDVVLGKNVTSQSFTPCKTPKNLNWELWQGQTPDVPYIEERSHYTFRWWYEYSGGQMTDWGAHHIDIAQWAINDLPIAINGTAKFPTIVNGFNVANDFEVVYDYANGVKLTVKDHGENGILFTGDLGRIFVNRGKITGAPVEALSKQPFPRETWNVYDFDNLQRPARAGKLDAIVNHMGNFFDCIQSRRLPISDVEDQHRSVSTCHLGNISMRLGRALQWNPATEQFVNDPEANKWLRRDQRKGYEASA
jgi:myo-inositol 2-dehydrogenase / D-chiro-inositol 1-dehydrogenase